MRRIALVLACICTCAILALSVQATPSTPAWSDLDHKVSASSGPVSIGCYEKCDHAGAGGVCQPIEEVWMCGYDLSGGCRSTHVCF